MLTLGYADKFYKQAFSVVTTSSVVVAIARGEMKQRELVAQFDQWAETYDEELAMSGDTFPFAGYYQVLATILDRSKLFQGMSVLDLGVGTGNLARLFIDAGCQVAGLDFSPIMLEKARAKLPRIELLQADLAAKDWPDQIDQRFHRIVSNYTFHEFPLNTKLDILSRLARDHLLRNGFFIIGDIMFPEIQDLENARLASGDAWEEEYYWVTVETRNILESAGWKMSVDQLSFCSGVYVLYPPVSHL